MRLQLFVLASILSMLLLAGVSSATYTITNINTTVYINANASAHVTEMITFVMNNDSISNYNLDRSGVNLTLSNWEYIVGPDVVPHIINQKMGIYNFNLLPGPVVTTYYGGVATIYMNYYVKNVTSINQTGPRTYLYKFNSSVLNFQHGSGGVVLGPHTRLNIVIPSGSSILSIYPLPDVPSNLVLNSTNTTEVSWYDGEPLYNFKLIYSSKESLISEVSNFFMDIYNALGVFAYLIIIFAVIIFILYTYYKVH